MTDDGVTDPALQLCWAQLLGLHFLLDESHENGIAYRER